MEQINYNKSHREELTLLLTAFLNSPEPIKGTRGPKFTKGMVSVYFDFSESFNNHYIKFINIRKSKKNHIQYVLQESDYLVLCDAIVNLHNRLVEEFNHVHRVTTYEAFRSLKMDHDMAYRIVERSTPFKNLVANNA